MTETKLDVSAASVSGGKITPLEHANRACHETPSSIAEYGRYGRAHSFVSAILALMSLRTRVAGNCLSG